MRRRPVRALIGAVALVMAGAGGLVAADAPATWLSTYVWDMDHPRFGGMSAIELEPDGSGFVALSDRGSILAGRFQRDGEGRITGVDAGPIGALRGRTEGPLPHSRSDSEGLAISPDGTVYISFEIAPRVLRYRHLHGKASYLPIPRDFSALRSNGALEALAIAPDGTLYTLPEESLRPDGGFPIYRYRNGAWDQPFVLPQAGGFLPVGADFGPDGRLYLLERDFGILGFSTRVRRFVVTDAAIDGGETILQTDAGTYGDLEGIDVWRDAQGRLRLTMIADNNFKSFLDTQIVEYLLRD